MAKLSNREKAAKKSGGTLDYKTGKITVAPKAKPAPFKGAGFSGTKSMAELGGMSPGMIAYQRNLDKQYYASPQSKIDSASYATKGMNAEAESSSIVTRNRRNMAAKAKLENDKKSDSSLIDKASDLASSAGAKLRNVPGLKQIGEYGDDYVNTGNKSSLAKVLAPFAVGAAIPAGMFAAGAGAAGGMSSLAGVGRGVIGQGAKNLFRGGVKNFGDDVVSKMPTSALPIAGAVGTGAAGFVPSIGSIMGNGAENNPFGQSVDDVVSSYPDPTQTGGGDQGQDDNSGFDPSIDKEMNVGSPEIDTQNDPSLVAEMGMEQDYSQTQNNAYGGDPITDKPGGTTRRPYGSGAFGTGKGVQSDDPYIKELRKAYSSNGGEKWLRKQFEELIASLDPTYAALQKEGTDALQAQLLNNNTQLASVMNANNTGDSEQRAQLMAGQQRDSQTALGNLLAKLAQSKAGDVSQYKQSYAEQRGKLEDRNQSNAQTLLEKMRAYQNDQYDQKYKNASLAGRGGTTKAGSLSYLGDDANGNPVYYNTTTGQRTTEAGLKRKQSNPLEEAMAALLGQGQQGSGQVQYDENGRPYIEQ